MRVLYLGKPSPVLDYLYDVEDEVWQTEQGPLVPDPNVQDRDLLVSYGYRHKIPPEVLALFPHRAINLHIGYLPWNRGAHPNAFSFYDGTPQGVTIHELDEGWDTGPILTQMSMAAPPSWSLALTYHWLQNEVTRAFLGCWRNIRNGKMGAYRHNEAGSFHTKADFEQTIKPLLTDGWRTPVSVLAEAGRKARDSE